MRKVVALLALAACGDDGTTKKSIDAPSPGADAATDASPDAAPPRLLSRFSFLKANNPSLPHDIVARVGRSKVAVGVPVGTDLTNLVATFETDNATVTVGGAMQMSGATANDFTNGVTYNVTDGTTTIAFKVGIDVGGVPAGIARDFAGNTYFAGYTPSHLFEQPAADGYDIFVIKEDASGDREWSRQIGSAPMLDGVGMPIPASTNDWVMGLAVDSRGHVFVVGETTGNLDGMSFGNQTDYGYDAYLLELDKDGTTISTKQIASAPRGVVTNPQDLIRDIAIDPSDNVFVILASNGDLDGNTHVGPNQENVLLSKYTAGVRQWTHLVDPEALEPSVAASPDGSVYVSGFTLGAIGASYVGNGDAFLIKLDAEGVPVWKRQIGSTEEDAGSHVGVDELGNPYVAGYTRGSFDHEPHIGVKNVFVTKYDALGTQQWIHQLPGDANDHQVCSSIGGSSTWRGHTDKAGNTYVVGFTTSDPLDGHANAGGCGDGFVVKYDTNGDKQWVRLAGIAETVETCVTTLDGNVYVGGLAGSEVDGNLFINAYDPSGNPL